MKYYLAQAAVCIIILIIGMVGTYNWGYTSGDNSRFIKMFEGIEAMKSGQNATSCDGQPITVSTHRMQGKPWAIEFGCPDPKPLIK